MTDDRPATPGDIRALAWAERIRRGGFMPLDLERWYEDLAAAVGPDGVLTRAVQLAQ